MLNATLKNAIQDCVDYACQSDRPIQCVYEFVRTLVDAKGWSEVDARAVGIRALTVAETWAKR